MSGARTKPDAGTLLEIHLRELGLRFEREYRFHLGRKWRADFLITHKCSNYLLEIEGGIWSGGAHVRGEHFLSDAEKYNHATMMGYHVLRFSVEQVENGEVKEFLGKWLT